MHTRLTDQVLNDSVALFLYTGTLISIIASLHNYKWFRFLRTPQTKKLFHESQILLYRLSLSYRISHTSSLIPTKIAVQVHLLMFYTYNNH